VPGADFEHLDDRGLLARAEGGDAGGQRLGIGALEDGDDPVVGLRGVEVRRDLFETLAELAAHRVPPLDLGLGRSRGRAEGGEGRGEEEVAHPVLSVVKDDGARTVRK
jgi:hypothetical protein